ncbi:MAG: alpha-amylase family glycosyl hydrolase [Caldilineales bacterium]
MNITHWHQQEAARSLQRLLPRLEARFAASPAADWQSFHARLTEHFPALFSLLLHLYGNRYDFFFHLEEILNSAAEAWLQRPADLKTLDAQREAHPAWLQDQTMLGGVCYVDLFAGDLAGVRAQIPYFKELGLTYLHLMPLFASPAGDNDGGYAVSSYRQVNPALGSMNELAELARDLRANGISLVVDFVFNHTSHEHAWAQQAIAGDAEYRDYYFIFPDRTTPDAYERTLREIFPDVRRGSFTYRADIDSWVWTTFYSFQWDLNYANPVVFRRMGEEMLFLANQGVEILRLDAVAFIWKQMGTACENLPEAHLIIQAYNALARIAAPVLTFKSEAIVHPDEVARYISPQECQLSYNPLLMALLWESLATRQVKLLQASLRDRFHINPTCAWVNYVRCHDDIGWTFDDADAGRVGINGYDHRRFLNTFYTGRFPGSFARGLPFQENPQTGDARISGTCASLAGLERALYEQKQAETEHAIARILLIHSIILSIGGIPLIYLGDEVGMLNDYRYAQDAAKANDSRWVHRPFADWQRIEQRHDAAAVPGRVYSALQHLITLRKAHIAFGSHDTTIMDTGNPHVFGYSRQQGGERVLVLANFSEHAQVVDASLLRIYGLGYGYHDLISNESWELNGGIRLGSYQVMWLHSADH